MGRKWREGVERRSGERGNVRSVVYCAFSLIISLSLSLSLSLFLSFFLSSRRIAKEVFNELAYEDFLHYEHYKNPDAIVDISKDEDIF